MLYQIYNTDAFIVSSVGVGETNGLLYLFTKNLGIIPAEARGIRKLDSKLKYNLQPYSITSVSLVKGKVRWRVIDAREVLSLSKIQAKNEAVPLIRSLILLKRLSGHEIPTETLFDSLKNAAIFLTEHKMSKDELFCLEVGLVLEVLYSLGYMSKEKMQMRIGRGAIEIGGIWTRELLAGIGDSEKELVFLINESIKESQL